VILRYQTFQFGQFSAQFAPFVMRPPGLIEHVQNQVDAQ
jgi:hypothetical protein